MTRTVLLLIALMIPLSATGEEIDIPRLADVVCNLETRNDPFPEWAISRRGAVGLCQLLTETAQRMWTRAGLQVKYHPSLLFNGSVSRRLAKAYLAYCLGYGWRGTYELAFCYHNGHRATRRTQGKGHEYALEVKAEYDRAMLARR